MLEKAPKTLPLYEPALVVGFNLFNLQATYFSRYEPKIKELSVKVERVIHSNAYLSKSAVIEYNAYLGGIIEDMILNPEKATQISYKDVQGIEHFLECLPFGKIQDEKEYFKLALCLVYKALEYNRKGFKTSVAKINGKLSTIKFDVDKLKHVDNLLLAMKQFYLTNKTADIERIEKLFVEEFLLFNFLNIKSSYNE